MKVIKQINGSGGPTKIDADIMKSIICSKVFGKEACNFAEHIALLMRRICIEDIPYDHLQLLWACRLVPLIKGIDGIRPISIGEVIRKILGKCVLSIL